jgi:hypothetical protein
MLQLNKDEMQTRLEPSTAPHLVRRDKVTIATNNLFLRGQPTMKLRDRRLRPFTMEGKIGKLLALASRCIVLMYKVAICLFST